MSVNDDTKVSVPGDFLSASMLTGTVGRACSFPAFVTASYAILMATPRLTAARRAPETILAASSRSVQSPAVRRFHDAGSAAGCDDVVPDAVGRARRTASLGGNAPETTCLFIP